MLQLFGPMHVILLYGAKAAKAWVDADRAATLEIQRQMREVADPEARERLRLKLDKQRAQIRQEVVERAEAENRPVYVEPGKPSIVAKILSSLFFILVLACVYQFVVAIINL